MKSFNVIYVILISLLLPACDKPESKEKQEFIQICKSESNKSDRECGCIFDKNKDKYSQKKLLDYLTKDVEIFSAEGMTRMIILGACE